MAEASPYALRLSQAASWVRCAASVPMQRTPQAAVVESLGDNTIREEGTAIHWVAERLDDPFGRRPQVGDVAPNGVTITDELFDSAEFYVETLAEYGAKWHIEEQLSAPSIHPNCGGTPDAFCCGATQYYNVLIVADLKGGYRPIEVFPNWQLIGYASAILDNYPEWRDDVGLMIEFVIVQPRAYHRDGPVRKQMVAFRDLLPYIDALRMAASIAMGEHAPAIAGPQCDDCAARVGCSVCHAAGMRALEVSGEPDMHDLPVAAIDYEMLRLEDAARMIEARLTGLQAQAAYLIRKGEQFPHYAMEAGKGRKVWIDEQAEQAAIAMGDLLGANLRKPAKAVTPLQAANVLPKEFVESYTQQRRGELKLVRFDGNRAVKAFSHLKKD